MSLNDNISDIFSENGLLYKRINSFVYRPSQQQMAVVVSTAIHNKKILVCEAGTGTGKTVAYLVPALLSNKKVVISTGTKPLQDQLFLRDLPLILKSLDINKKVVMLKGRANYLCPYRLKQAEQSVEYMNAEHLALLSKIRSWYDASYDGEISGMKAIAEDAIIWYSVTSTAENCLGQECPDYDQCPVFKARREALSADILIINHYLLFSDMLLREQGFGELLPAVDALILDEAHQIADIATKFFGGSLSNRQLTEWVNDSLTEYITEAGDLPQFKDALIRLERAINKLRHNLGSSSNRVAWSPLLLKPVILNSVETLSEELSFVVHLLDSLSGRGKGLEACWRRGVILLQTLNLFENDSNESNICWCEISRSGFVLHETPIDIAEDFARHMKTYAAAWIFTSATLSVGGEFTHFTRRLGLHDCTTAIWDSIFDYKRISGLYLPENMPEPSSPAFICTVIKRSIPVIHACGGRTFMLFTSHRALQEAARLLKYEGLSYPLLVQGDRPRNEMLQQFRQLGNAVLLGTGSFWEGVDVRGEALSCVIIDKLPFATPGDPVLQARVEVMKKNGINPFIDFQLPNAVIALKQGAGRLIRDEKDYGVLMLCDPRLTSKPYGRIFLNNIPPMQRLHKLEDVENFYVQMRRTKENFIA